MGAPPLRLAAFVLSGLLVFADLGSKSAVFANLDSLARSHHVGVVAVPGFLTLRQIRNTGGVWGLGSDWGHYLVYFRILASLGLLIVLARSSNSYLRLIVGLSLVLAGAVGNLYDSFGHVFPSSMPEQKSVRDFLYFHIGGSYFPAFNIADVCICVGAAFLVLHMTCERR